MKRTTRQIFTASAAALCYCLASLYSANAAPINYGNFLVPVPPAFVAFTNVTESSGTDPVPLYGPPAPYPVGLSFNPAGFVASAAGGAADITDGQLNFSVLGAALTPTVGVGIAGISLLEGGDFSLVGLGTAATSVFAGASMRVNVTEIDGIPVAPIPLFANGGFATNLLLSPGLVQPWQAGVSVPISAQLAVLGVPFNIGATKVDVVIDNVLIALSEPATAALIAKKFFSIDVIPDPHPFPEPSSAVLAFVALCGAGLSAARKRD